MACEHWVILIRFRWTEGKYGEGHRISLHNSELILDAINSGKLDQTPMKKFKYFNFDVPIQI